MTDTMEYAEATQADNLTTEEIVHQSTLFMESAARVLEQGEIYAVTRTANSPEAQIYYSYERLPLTEFQRRELLQMISLAGRNARVAYQAATRDYGGIYAALVSHTESWSKPIADHFEAVQNSIDMKDKRTGSHLTPRDWRVST